MQTRLVPMDCPVTNGTKAEEIPPEEKARKEDCASRLKADSSRPSDALRQSHHRPS